MSENDRRFVFVIVLLLAVVCLLAALLRPSASPPTHETIVVNPAQVAPAPAWSTCPRYPDCRRCHGSSGPDLIIVPIIVPHGPHWRPHHR